MKSTALLLILAVAASSLLIGCSKAEDKGGQATLPGDYATEPGKGGAAAKSTATPGQNP